MNHLRLGIVLMAMLWGCSKDLRILDEEDLPFDSISPVKNEPGFGETDGEHQGTPFTLPAGVRLVDRPHHRFDPDIEKLYGKINTFYVDIHLVRDSTWKGESVVFPPGLILTSQGEGRIQHGLLIGRELIPVPYYRQGTSNDTLTYYLGVACINAKKAFPWEDNFEDDVKEYVIGKGMYKPTVITQNPQILQFLSLFEDKEHLKVTQHINPWDQFNEGYVRPSWQIKYDVIQEMLWKITDEKGLTKRDLSELLIAIER